MGRNQTWNKTPVFKLHHHLSRGTQHKSACHTEIYSAQNHLLDVTLSGKRNEQ